jgi:hypothetical protein
VFNDDKGSEADAIAAWNRRAVAQPETPTPDALDAGVEEAARKVSCEYPSGFYAGHIAALIAAVEARAVARERARECVWTRTATQSQGYWLYRTSCGGSGGIGDGTPNYCDNCGGRVRVESA